MSNITAFAEAGLPSVDTLADSLRNLRSSAAGDGMTILKMDKTGHWVYGADQTEVEDDSLWAVNPFSFVHGYIAWGDGEVLGEKMAPTSQPLPDTGPAPEGSKRGWEMQVGMMLACTNGEDEGLQTRFTTNSVGGKKAVVALAVAIADHVDKDASKPVPLVRLRKEHYQHKSYGRIYTPVFEVVDWVSMDADTVEAEPEVEEQPTRRRRRS